MNDEREVRRTKSEGERETGEGLHGSDLIFRRLPKQLPRACDRVVTRFTILVIVGRTALRGGGGPWIPCQRGIGRSGEGFTRLKKEEDYLRTFPCHQRRLQGSVHARDSSVCQ